MVRKPFLLINLFFFYLCVSKRGLPVWKMSFIIFPLFIFQKLAGLLPGYVDFAFLV